MNAKLVCLIFSGLFWTASYAVSAPDRVALVIGNGQYEHGDILKNAPNDAKLIAKALRDCGFEVDLAIDSPLDGMEKKLLSFRRKAESAKAAWFYYAGHGLEVKGVNYLLPVDVLLEEEFQVKSRSMSLDTVMDALDEAKTPLKVIVLDCCRENPFARSWHRGKSRGLSQISGSPEGTIISFSAAPGKTATDGEGDNGPYTKALAEALRLPGLEIEQVFKETGRKVMEATEREQQPWLNISFFDSFKPVGDESSYPKGKTSPLAPKTVVVAVGVNQYSPTAQNRGVHNLTAADADAKELARMLGGGDAIALSTAGPQSGPEYATAGNIRAAVKKSFDKLSAETTAVFSFSGYEIQFEGSDEYFLLPADGDPDHPETMIPLSEVGQILGNSGAGTKLVIIDACRGKEARGAKSPKSPPPGVAYWFACSAGELAYESSEAGVAHGLFSASLLKAIQGAADSDRNGIVDFGELSRFTLELVPKTAKSLSPNKSQVPEIIGDPGRPPAFPVHSYSESGPKFPVPSPDPERRTNLIPPPAVP